MTDKEDSCARWKEQISAFSFPYWNDLPEIDLYMDQVVSYLSQKLSVFYEMQSEEENKSITATMINNYVKQKIIPAPVKKRYNRTHLSALIMLFCVKQVLSIGLSGQMIAVCSEGREPQEVYDRFCDIFEKILRRTAESDHSAETDACIAAMMQTDPVTVTTAVAFANKLYAEKLIVTAAEAAGRQKKA